LSFSESSSIPLCYVLLYIRSFHRHVQNVTIPGHSQ
jgi:hypothetical protein